MNIPTDPKSRLKQLLLQLLHIALYMTTVVLGFYVLTTTLDAVDAQVLKYTFDKIASQEMGEVAGAGLRRIANYATVFIVVMLWIVTVCIAGMEYHFKRIGKRSSYRVFAWTIGIECALIFVALLLRNP